MGANALRTLKKLQFASSALFFLQAIRVVISITIPNCKVMKIDAFQDGIAGYCVKKKLHLSVKTNKYIDGGENNPNNKYKIGNDITTLLRVNSSLFTA